MFDRNKTLKYCKIRIHTCICLLGWAFILFLLRFFLSFLQGNFPNRFQLTFRNREPKPRTVLTCCASSVGFFDRYSESKSYKCMRKWALEALLGIGKETGLCRSLSGLHQTEATSTHSGSSWNCEGVGEAAHSISCIVGKQFLAVHQFQM